MKKYLKPIGPEEWYYWITPFELHTQAARDLFDAAVDWGLLEWIETNAGEVLAFDASPIYALAPGPGIKNRAQLAYFCVLASTYLRLDRGELDTFWEPFDKVFSEGRAPLKKSLSSIGFAQQERETDGIRRGKHLKTQPGVQLIEEFFLALKDAANQEGEPTPSTPTSTTTSTEQYK